MITLGHVNIRTTNIERTCVFYETVLRFRRAQAVTNPDPASNVWLCDDGGMPSLHINVFRPGERVPDENISCLHHLAFNCPDRDAMTDRLHAAGIAYEVVETRVPGLTQFNLQDPNGVRVELTFGHELALTC